MPGQRERILDWPYTEGLRMDEAMNPLTLLATGILRKTVAEPGRRPGASGHAMEIRFQGSEGDCEDPLHGTATPDRMDAGGPVGVRFLRECESRCGSSALEPGYGTADWRVPET